MTASILLLHPLALSLPKLMTKVDGNQLILVIVSTCVDTSTRLWDARQSELYTPIEDWDTGEIFPSE